MPKIEWEFDATDLVLDVVFLFGSKELDRGRIARPDQQSGVILFGSYYVQ
jgi:hypothetical protein